MEAAVTQIAVGHNKIQTPGVLSAAVSARSFGLIVGLGSKSKGQDEVKPGQPTDLLSLLYTT